MENHLFWDPYYIVTVYNPEGSNVECYSCDSKEEVYQVLTTLIRNDIENIDPDLVDEDFGSIEDMEAFMELLSSNTISNPELIKQCFDTFCNRGMAHISFSVTDYQGNVWFRYKC